MKVAIDTNVFVAASMNAQAEEGGARVKHQFYDQSALLRAVAERGGTGITTETVAEEAPGALIRALEGGRDRQELDESVSLVESCEAKMEEMFSAVEIVSPDGGDVAAEELRVRRMSEYLLTHYLMCVGRDEAAADERYSAAIREARPKWGLSAEAYAEHAEQIKIEQIQLKRFARAYPHRNDMRILAECAAAKGGMGGEEIFIASTDTGFFSPTHLRGDRGRSDFVTRQIEAWFGITCDWPAEIVALLP